MLKKTHYSITICPTILLYFPFSPLSLAFTTFTFLSNLPLQNKSYKIDTFLFYAPIYQQAPTRFYTEQNANYTSAVFLESLRDHLPHIFVFLFDCSNCYFGVLLLQVWIIQ